MDKDGKKKQMFAGFVFSAAIVATAAAALAFPGALIEWGGVKLITLVAPALQLIMFGMGTTLSGGDFARVAKRPWAVALGVGLQFLVMPTVGFALARALALDDELAAGCILVGSVAGGTASNVISFLAKADVALSVSMTCVSTLLSPFVTPLAMKLLAGRFIEVDALKMTLEILKIVIVPVVLGAGVRRAFARQFERHGKTCNRALSLVSMAGICFTLAVITAPGRDVLSRAGLAIFAAAAAHNAVGYLAGYWLTRLAGRFARLGEREARTVAIEVGMQNGGMASALAINVLGSAAAALPGSVFSLWMNFSGALLAARWSLSAPPGDERHAACDSNGKEGAA